LELVEVELLRSRLESAADEAALTIQRTSMSPIITDTLDFSATLLDRDGRLVAGGGFVLGHWYACSHAVQATIAKFGDTVAPGDVFFANDPHTGGGFHPSDVVVQRPIFAGGELVAWIALSSHMYDMGGMEAGSMPAAATECYQEAIRVPPVRLAHQGVEQRDLWDFLLNNVRGAHRVEMDMRALVAGAHVADRLVAGLAEAMGPDVFRRRCDLLNELTEASARRVVETIADGRYTVRNWIEWGTAMFVIPCELTVSGDSLRFDFEGAAPQAPHFFNSKPYIIKAGIGTVLAQLLGEDLPANDGLFRVFDVVCPEGSIMNCRPPAPISLAHFHAANIATEVATECVHLALAASPGAAAHGRLAGWAAELATGISHWTYRAGGSS
jgi:N-methylhydantoinase B